MRIALACPYSLDTPGGVQSHVLELAAEWRRRGHETLTLAPGRSSEVRPGIRTFGKPRRFAYGGKTATLAPSPLTYPSIRKTLRSFNPDIVHVHEPFVPGPALYAAWASSRPLVATFHASAERSPLLELAAPLLRPVARKIGLAIAVSETAADFIRKTFPALNLIVVPNGVDTAAFAGSAPENLPAGPRIVWINRLDPQKGFPVMGEAFARLAERHPKAVLLVVGDGADRAAVEGLPTDIRGRIKMLGTVDRARIPRLLAAADVYVSAACGQESFGIILVEAMAAGAPVVATNIDGYREVVRKDVDGLLVPPGDPAALAGAIDRILSDPALADRLRAAGKRRAENFDWKVIADRLEELYERLTRS